MENIHPPTVVQSPKAVPQNNIIALKNGIRVAKEQIKQTSDSFPVSAFPDKIQRIITDCTENLNFIPDFLGCGLLFGASIAIGNRFRVRIKEGYQQSAALYMAIVAEPGIGKTPNFDFGVQPLHQFEREYSKQYKAAKKEYDNFQALSKEKRENQAEPPEPVRKQHTINDSTPEALIKALSENPEGLGLFRDELAAWINNFSRYQKGDEEQMWLELWNNKTHKTNRVAKGVTEVHVPFISVGGGLQPQTLREIFKGRTDNGFLDRILFSFPTGLQKKPQPETDISPDTPRIWFEIISKLIVIPLQLADNDLNIPAPRLLWLSSAAKSKYREFDTRNSNLCNDPENKPFAGAWSKLDMYVYRLSLILELLEYACNGSSVLPTEISDLAMDRAIRLAEYFRIHIKRAISLVKEINPLDGLPANEIALYNALPEKEFSIKQTRPIAEKFGLRGGSYDRFLNNTGLFYQPKRGNYAKKL
jgi:hypothetical protein